VVSLIAADQALLRETAVRVMRRHHFHAENPSN
jgi:hypothetical protein